MLFMFSFSISFGSLAASVCEDNPVVGCRQLYLTAVVIANAPSDDGLEEE
jgi:hypothetical protein